MPSSSSAGHSSLSAQLGSSRYHSVSDGLPVCSQKNTGIAPTDNAVLNLVDDGSDGECVDLDNPFKDTYLPAVSMMPTMRDMVGTNVYTLTVAAVRKHAKTLAVKKAGMNRAQLRGLLFAAVAAKVKMGDAGWSSVLGDNCSAFLTNPENQTRASNVAPSDEILHEFAPSRATDLRRRARPGGTVVEPSGAALVGPLFTLSEFGRLICVLLQDPELRNVLLASGLNLRRLTVAWAVMTFGDIRWSEFLIIDQLLVSLAFTGHLNGVDVQAPPPVYRAGEKLKFMFFKARGAFTSTYSKWSVSGQNDPEKFVDYLLILPRSTEISVEGKKALVLFVSMRCGTPEEDTDILNFTKKTCPQGVGYDDLDTSESCNDRTRRHGGSARRHDATVR
jgi:hypothetical protein